MTDSWKIGAISGLIAGIVFAIVSEILFRITLSIGLWEPWYRPFLVDNFLVNLPLNCFWGIVLGVIYSKVHNLLPGQGVLKGLVYGLFLFVIIDIRALIYNLPYGQFLTLEGWLFWSFFIWTSYGLSLGTFFKLLHNRYLPAIEETKIITYDMKSGLHPGAIAGLCGGIVAGTVSVVGHVTGQWGLFGGGEIVNTIEFWYNQFGHHVLINMIWGTIFGLFFAKVYNLVPGKKVLKGIYYGLMIFFITSFQQWTWMLVEFANHGAWQYVNVVVLDIFAYSFDYLIYGLVLGYLYRKPSE